jgi:hypothetical protein
LCLNNSWTGVEDLSVQQGAHAGSNSLETEMPGESLDHRLIPNMGNWLASFSVAVIYRYQGTFTYCTAILNLMISIVYFL